MAHLLGSAANPFQAGPATFVECRGVLGEDDT
jgi:hypothetical protein